MTRLLVAIALCCPSFLFCQTGTIRGQVTDARTGDPLVGVNIIIVGSKPGHGAASDMNGMFMMTRIPPGEYVVRASYLEYQTVTLRNVRVAAGQTTETDLAMRREGEEEPVGDTLVVQKDTSRVSPSGMAK